MGIWFRRSSPHSTTPTTRHLLIWIIVIGPRTCLIQTYSHVRARTCCARCSCRRSWTDSCKRITVENGEVDIFWTREPRSKKQLVTSFWLLHATTATYQGGWSVWCLAIWDRSTISPLTSNLRSRPYSLKEEKHYETRNRKHGGRIITWVANIPDYNRKLCGCVVSLCNCGIPKPGWLRSVGVKRLRALPFYVNGSRTWVKVYMIGPSPFWHSKCAKSAAGTWCIQ